MKVLMANNYFYLRGGAEKVFFEEMEMLEANGHQVVPFSRHFENNVPSPYASFFAPFFQYENIPYKNKVSAALNLIYSPEAKRCINEIIQVTRPDVLHAHNIYGRLTTSILDCAQHHNIPVVMTLHDHKLICPSYLMLHNKKVCDRCIGQKFFYCLVKRCHKGSLLASLVNTVEAYHNYLLNKFDSVSFFVCPSRYLLEKHVRAGVPRAKLVHIPNFIKTQKYKPEYRPGKYILFVGRISHEKGVCTLLEAVKGRDIQLKIAGDGPLRGDLSKYVLENRYENIEFLGPKSGDELQHLFLQSAFTVVPSECSENAPMSILESFAYGKPVVGSAIGGVPEMVLNHETGFLFNPGSPEDLWQKINTLYTNPGLITEMGKRCRNMVEQSYSDEFHYASLIELYRSAGVS